MRIVYTNGFFRCECSFENRFLPMFAGFHWSAVTKSWYTEEVRTAIALREYFDTSAQEKIKRLTIQRNTRTAAPSFPDHLSLKPYQTPAIEFALSQNKSYLAMAPGLGKTIVAAVIMNTLNRPTVIVCPPFLVLNWRAEIEKWAPHASTPFIFPDTVIDDPETRSVIQKLFNGRSALLIVDEAHRFKTGTAKRTQALLGSHHLQGIRDHFHYEVYLSGTPMPNRPIELYPILSKVAPETIDFMSEHEYGLRFCDAKFRQVSKTRSAWDYTGASNVEELSRRVSPFIFKMPKSVAKDLPKKREEMVILGESPPRLIAMEREILRRYSPEDLVKKRFLANRISTYRKDLGLLKVKPAAKFLRSILEEESSPLLVFAFHKEVIANLKKELEKFKPLMITGSTSKEERNEIVKTFQAEGNLRPLIGNYLAAGLGLTLTRAKRVVMVEFSYVPAENEQAGDRVHRISQTEDVLIQYLLYENSLDMKTMEINFAKKAIISKL